MANRCKNFDALYNRKHHHCGNCRKWLANLKSRTNSRPLKMGENACLGDK